MYDLIVLSVLIANGSNAANVEMFRTTYQMPFIDKATCEATKEKMGDMLEHHAKLGLEDLGKKLFHTDDLTSKGIMVIVESKCVNG